MQMFHRSVTQVSKGDRAGICVTQLDSKLIERGLAAAPGTVPTFRAAVACVDKIRFYADAVASKTKYHVSIGHATVMADVQFFGQQSGQGVPQDSKYDASDVTPGGGCIWYGNADIGLPIQH